MPAGVNLMKNNLSEEDAMEVWKEEAVVVSGDEEGLVMDKESGVEEGERQGGA